MPRVDSEESRESIGKLQKYAIINQSSAGITTIISYMNTFKQFQDSISNTNLLHIFDFGYNKISITSLYKYLRLKVLLHGTRTFMLLGCCNQNCT